MGRVSRRSSLRAATTGKENQENMAGSYSGKIKKKSKIRAMPDFSKLHKHWEEKLKLNRPKKPLTLVQEFGFSKKGQNLKEEAKCQDERVPTSCKENKPGGTIHLQMPRESFGSMAHEQEKQGLEFQADSSALQSILDETGVTTENITNTATADNHGKSTTGSLVTRGYTSTVGMLRKTSVFAGLLKSEGRLTEAGFKLPPLPHRLTVGTGSRRVSNLRESSVHRGCEACHTNKPHHHTKTPTKDMERRNEPNTPFRDCKAERIVINTPKRCAKSPGFKQPMTESRAMRVPVRPPLKSPMKKAHSAGRRPAPSATWRDVLQQQKEAGKKDDTVKRLDLDDCDGSEEEQVPRCQGRPVLGQLPEAEVARRSRPEFREEKKAAKFEKTKFTEPASPKHGTERAVTFESPKPRHQSPSSRYRMNKATNCAPTNSNLSPKAPRASALKSQQSRYSPLKTAQSPGGTRRRLQSAEVDKENCSPVTQRVRHTQAPQGKDLMVLGKVETKVAVKHASVKQSSTKHSNVKLLKETSQEFLLLEESYEVMNELEVSAQLDQSLVVMETLQNEATNLLEQSALGDDSTNDIAAQLQMIAQKQDKLMRMQQMLHQRLANSKARKQRKAAAQHTHQAVDKTKHASVVGATMATYSHAQGRGNELRTPERRRPQHSSKGNIRDVSPIGLHQTTSVVDMSPIGGSCVLDTDCNQSPSAIAMRTPEKGASPSLLYKAHKRSPLFPPLESTASESVYQRNNDKEQSKQQDRNENDGAVQQNQQQDGLAAGLLQMAQQLNATPHKSTHWKKQMLKEDSNSAQDFEDHALPTSPFLAGVGGESFVSLDNQETATPIGKPFSLRTAVGTPSLTMCTPSTLLAGSPQLYGSPKRLFSGSAQVIPELWGGVFTTKQDPIHNTLTPLEKGMQENQTYANTDTNAETCILPSLSSFDISIDASQSPEEMSIAFNESPDEIKEHGIKQTNFRADFKFTPLNTKEDKISSNALASGLSASKLNLRRLSEVQPSPGSAFTSPTSRRGSLSNHIYASTLTSQFAAASPVQFTMNRKNSPSIVRPVPCQHPELKSKAAVETSTTKTERFLISDLENSPSVLNFNKAVPNNRYTFNQNAISVQAPSQKNSPNAHNNHHFGAVKLSQNDQSGSSTYTPSIAGQRSVCLTTTSSSQSAASPRCSIKSSPAQHKKFSPQVIYDRSSNTAVTPNKTPVRGSPLRPRATRAKDSTRSSPLRASPFRASPNRSPRASRLTPQIGELTLRGNVKSPAGVSRRAAGGWSELQRHLASTLLQRCGGQDLLCDHEVEFYMTRQQVCSQDNGRCFDPVANILEAGDEHHFVPIPVAESRLEQSSGNNVRRCAPLTPRRSSTSAFTPIRL